MIYALIKNGIVVNVIVADPNFISLIQSKWDYCVRIDNLNPCPRIGDLYDGSQFAFQIP